jgi:hypothetical protein
MADKGASAAILSRHEYEWAHIFFREDDIVEVHLFPVRYNGRRVAGVIDEIVRLSGRKNLLVLIVTNPRSTVSLSGITTVFSNESVNYSAAKAYVFHNGIQFFLAKFGKLVFRPRRPIRFYNNRGMAEAWLRSFQGYGI